VEYGEEPDVVGKLTRSKSVAAKAIKDSTPSETPPPSSSGKATAPAAAAVPTEGEQGHNVVNFTKETRCIVYGLQQRAVQGMLDFDFMCKRKQPSVAAMIFPFSGNHYIKFYWGTSEVLIPVYQKTSEACEKHPDVNVVVNFSSFRSVYGSMEELFQHSNQIKTIAIIAEGVPESQTRRIIYEAEQKGVGISARPLWVGLNLVASELETPVGCSTILCSPSCTVQGASRTFLSPVECRMSSTASLPITPTGSTKVWPSVVIGTRAPGSATIFCDTTTTRM